MMEPVLLIGGTGALGRAIAHWLRKRNPSLPITIAARDQTRARELAAKLGAASATSLDLTRIDLGLGDRRFGIVVPAFKDHAHVSYRFAQERGIPYLALSEAAFELAPLVAMYAHRPRSPLLLAGHVHGALPALVALGLTRHLARVESLSLGAIFDPNDPLPPGAEVDMERIVRAGPPPLALVDGAWRWLSDAKRTIEREPGKSVEAEA
ncbi:MAG: NAD(P)-dependent oxidoreductase, partial [Polyangiales bacterium]